jgi:hypothetical protein
MSVVQILGHIELEREPTAQDRRNSLWDLSAGRPLYIGLALTLEQFRPVGQEHGLGAGQL